MSSQSFADLGVSNAVASALANRGITSPFPVQEMVIADVLDGNDVLVQSPTGSGKTLAFGVPMVDLVSAEARRPAALVLAPTRELATQIVEELREVARSRALSVAPVYGGVGLQAQARKAAKAHIVVATPGRLEDLLQRRDITLEHVGLLVLDEADRMLDMGFKPAVDRIVAKVRKDRQTMFFSATLEGAVGQIASAYTRNATRHAYKPKHEAKIDIQHRFVHLTHDGKMNALVKELKNAERGRTLVFVRTKRGADRLVKRLQGHDVPAVAMHGNKSQSQRQKALARFESGHVDTLVATDVAARGIDVPEITHVIQFDAPEDRDTFVHRTGRTARAGATGTGVSFVIADQHRDMRKIALDLGLENEFDKDSTGAPRGNGNGNSAPRTEHRGGGQRNGHGPSKGRSQNGNGRGRNGNGNRQEGSGGRSSRGRGRSSSRSR
jgi:ATP-dependent RNA helicase RhlE